jgi:hypothetical protein
MWWQGVVVLAIVATTLGCAAWIIGFRCGAPKTVTTAPKLPYGQILGNYNSRLAFDDLLEHQEMMDTYKGILDRECAWMRGIEWKEDTVVTNKMDQWLGDLNGKCPYERIDHVFVPKRLYDVIATENRFCPGEMVTINGATIVPSTHEDWIHTSTRQGPLKAYAYEKGYWFPRKKTVQEKLDAWIRKRFPSLRVKAIFVPGELYRVLDWNLPNAHERGFPSYVSFQGIRIGHAPSDMSMFVDEGSDLREFEFDRRYWFDE